MVRLGVSELVVGRVLNHAPQGVTARTCAYNAEKTHALITWATEIDVCLLPECALGMSEARTAAHASATVAMPTTEPLLSRAISRLAEGSDWSFALLSPSNSICASEVIGATIRRL